MIFRLLISFYFVSSCLAETWFVYVHTGNEPYAGTDSDVYISLINAHGESTRECKLTHYNWLAIGNQFPIRNLFERGSQDKFRIQTEKIGDPTEIYIRHNSFPAVSPDWFLERVILERNRDGTIYKFECNCWLRRDKPYTTILVTPDQHNNDKKKPNNSSSKGSRAFVIILLVLIGILGCIFCCINQYRRRQRHRSRSFIDTLEQIQSQPSLLDTTHSQQPEPSSPRDGPQFWMETLRRWKNVRDAIPSHHHTQTIQSTTVPTTNTEVIPSDAPPAYEDLYPNSTGPTNSTLSRTV